MIHRFAQLTTVYEQLYCFDKNRKFESIFERYFYNVYFYYLFDNNIAAKRCEVSDCIFDVTPFELVGVTFK